VSDRDGNDEIYVMNADGSSVTRITTNETDDLFPSWSPDGTQLLFRSDREGNPEVYRLDIDGTCPINLSRQSATPDGSRITDCHPGWTAQ
jgi:Tol biopolymer transport system component